MNKDKVIKVRWMYDFLDEVEKHVVKHKGKGAYVEWTAEDVIDILRNRFVMEDMAYEEK